MIETVVHQLKATPIWVLLISTFVIYQITSRLYEQYRVRRLGSYAPSQNNWWPLNLGFVYKAVQAGNRHETNEFWRDGFMKVSVARTGSYTMEVHAVAKRILITADPENIKAILATQFNDYGKGKDFNLEWKEFLGDSIFTTDHSQWHFSRQLIRPQFIKDRVSDLETFEKHFQIFMKQLPPSGQTFDIADLFFRYTLDAATDFLLGRSVDSLHHAQTTFATSFAEVQRIQNLYARLGPLQNLWSRKAYRAAIKDLNEFVNPYIEQTLRLSPQEIEEKGKSDAGYTFLHALAANTRDRTVIRDQLIAVLLAGRDTTACTLSWCFYELSTHPDVVRKLREEIQTVVGLDRAPTYADLKSMRYLTHTLNEVLRLYPVVPFNVRVAMHDTTLPRGGGPDGLSPVGVLAGTPVGYSALVMQRRADLYPAPSPTFAPHLAFSPERWDHWTPKSWTYIPFNGGPRICIGQQFALTEMGYTVVRLLQRFARVENRMPGPPKLKTEIVLQPAEGVQVALWEEKEG